MLYQCIAEEHITTQLNSEMADDWLTVKNLHINSDWLSII